VFNSKNKNLYELETKLKILHLEDSSADAELVERELKKGNIQFEKLVVSHKMAFENALKEFVPDIIISDHSLPSFDSFEAIKMIRQNGIKVPIVLVSATISDEFAVEIMKAGADDYILKDRLQRLPQAVLNIVEKYNLARTKEAATCELESSELRLKEAQRIAKLGSWETDLQTFDVKWSDELHRIFETDSKVFQVTHDAFLSFIHPEERNKVNLAFEHSFSKRSHNSIEHKIITKNGALKHVIENWKIINDDKGHPVRAVGTCQDITERKLADQEITKLSLVARKTTNSVVITDAHGKIQWVNDAFTALTGFELNEIMGKKPGAFLQGPETDPAVVRYMRKKISNRQAFKCDTVNYSKSGHKYWIRIQSQPEFDSIGKITGFFSIQTDISKEKDAEQAILKLSKTLTLATTSAKMGIWDWNLVDDIVTLDKRMYELYGNETLNITDTLNLRENSIHPDDFERLNNDINDAIMGIRDFKTEFRVVWPDKSIHFLEAHAIVSRNKKGIGIRMIGGNVDITERKEAEEELIKLNEEVAKSEKFFKGLIENSEDMITMIDITGKLIYASPAVSKKFGHTPEEILNSNIMEVIHPDDIPVASAFIADLVNYPSIAMPAPLIRERKKDGTYIWIEGTLTNFLETNGINAIVANFRDITERKIADEENKFRANILNTVGQAAIATDLNGIVNYWNKAAEQIYGWTKEEALGMQIMDLTISEASIEQANQIMEALRKGETWSGEFKVRRKDGTNFPALITNSPIYDENGELSGIIGISSDVTESKKAQDKVVRSETKLKFAQRIARVGSWEADLSTNEYSWSDEFYQILGINDDVKPSAEAFMLFVHPEDKSKTLRAMEFAFSKYKDSSCEFRFIRKNGDIGYALSKWKFEFESHDNSLHIRGILRDLTTEKKAERERTKMISDIVQRNSDLEQFSYIVSHNLRAPTANIIGFAEILQDELLTPKEQKELLQGLSASVTSLDAIIKDINAILQIKHNAHDKKEIVIFSKLVNDITISIDNLIKKHEVRLINDFSEVSEIYTLKAYMYSIFYNLIGNSIKYSKPNEQPIIEIKSKKENGKVIIIFKDNGLGIDIKTKQNKIFGLYNRFHSHVEGKGMGLFMVKTQVESLGGKITLISELNKGTEFTLAFEI
jgi:PAS domain S-box-containing protein